MPNTLHPKHPNYLQQYYAKWLASEMEIDGALRKVTSHKTMTRIMAGAEDRIAKADVLAELKNDFQAGTRKVFIWSDLHIFHKNIIQYTGRPYTSVDEMNNALLSAAQQTVTDEDWLLFIGDVTFGGNPESAAWLQDCPGRKVLVLGNHDVTNTQRINGLAPHFEAIVDCLDWELTEPIALYTGETANRLWFTHYPFWGTWVPDGVLNVHGHTHEKVFADRRMNVSVECISYRPQELHTMLRQGYPDKQNYIETPSIGNF